MKSYLPKNSNNMLPFSSKNSLQRIQEWQNLQRRMENICNNSPIYQALNNTLNQEYSSMSVPNQSQRLDPIPTYTPPEEQYPTQINIDDQGKRILNGSITHDLGSRSIGFSGGYSPGNINVGATYKKDKLSLQSSGTFGKDNSINPIFEYNSKNYGNFKVNSKIHPKNLQDSEGNVEWNWKF